MSDRPTIVSPGPLAAIAVGIVERLRIVFPETKFTLDFVPARVTPDIWRGLLRRPPFVGVGWAGMQTGNGSATELNGISAWVVYLATVNQSGPRARYLGDKLAPGLLDLVGVASAVLHGYNIPNCGAIQVQKAESAFVEGYEDDNLVTAAVDLLVRTSLPLSAIIGNVETGTLTLQDIQWSFDNGGAVALRDDIAGAP